MFCISSQQSLHILHYNLKLPDVYVGIVGWIYRTKIDPISILLVSLLFEQWSSLHLFSFQEMIFPMVHQFLFSAGFPLVFRFFPLVFRFFPLVFHWYINSAGTSILFSAGTSIPFKAAASDTETDKERTAKEAYKLACKGCGKAVTPRPSQRQQKSESERIWRGADQ